MNCTPFVRRYDILSNKWGAVQKCPACFTIKAHPQENAWIAVYEPNYHFPEYKQSSKRSKRPRKDVNEGMMPGNE